MTSLGTILPTRDSLRLSDEIADRENAEREAKGRALFASLERRVIGGETRYYKGESAFAIIGRAGRVLWFEVRGAHVYAARKP